MTDRHDPLAGLAQHRLHLAAGLALARPGAHRADGDHRLRALDHGVVGPEQTEVGPQGVGERRAVHDVLVGHVAVGEHDLLDAVLLHELRHLGLVAGRDAVGVQPAGQLGGVLAVLDVRDLGRGERHDLVLLVVAEVGVEVVEVAPRSSHDEDFRAFGHAHSCGLWVPPRHDPLSGRRSEDLVDVR